ncbi:hypothetical protein F4553_005335 [Allocatelliglobosispora scoriae]|uniref:Uncharacterized protein n=1 Tax=Allocatelliglobosispora scoriae TaxID=643052 RepID=A0A841BWR8_9ACTN|nr:hypothetical protein [Allocatelliglobosispora scoriae]MBB5871956.1 hypothetical protein [Allocatelliglobosispora scoriae]
MTFGYRVAEARERIADPCAEPVLDNAIIFGMSDEQEVTTTGTHNERRKVINLDDIKHAPTGDPLVDRGMQMTLDELEEAQADPDHPDHEAAKAAMFHVSRSLGSFLNTAYGDQFRRISENLAAALKPNLGNLFTAPRVKLTPTAAVPVRPPVPPALEVPEAEEWEIDETPQETLQALLEVSERMSEMVRVSAEHRDVAVQQMLHFRGEADASRKSGRRMLVLAWMALIGTWVAVVVAIVAL